MGSPSGRSAWGLRFIGTLKLATALTLWAAGFGIFRLLNRDLGAMVEHFALRLHLDPDNHLVHAVIDRIGGIDRNQLKAIGAGTLFYGLLESVEGAGLLLRRRWAEYLTVLATVLLLPLEFYELAHQVDWFRVAVLLAHLAVLVYLVVRLRRGGGDHPPISTGLSGDQAEGRAGGAPAVPGDAIRG